jgi:regulator of protease activity HflC (stomatin/prohibitin superfamily)
MFFSSTFVVPIIALLAIVLIMASVKILREYERAVVFTLVRVDLRIQVIEIPSQDVISRDNVSMKVDAVLWRIDKRHISYETF